MIYRYIKILIFTILIFIAIIIGINVNGYLRIKNIINKIENEYFMSENIDIKSKDIQKINKKVEKNSEEYFILGYLELKSEYLDKALNNITSNTDDFVKYYLYMNKSKEFIEKNDIKQAKVYTEKAIESIDLNKDNNAYLHIWNVLKSYLQIEDEKEYIVEIIENLIDESKLEVNTYHLRKKVAPIQFLIGKRDEAVQNLLQVIYLAEDKGDMYTQVKSLVDLSAICISLEAYEFSKELLEYSIELLKEINEVESSSLMELYIYTNLALINLNEYKLEDMKINIQKIYDSKGKINDEDYNDVLIMAKVYDSIYDIKYDNVEGAEAKLKEAKALCEKDKNILVGDRDTFVLTGQANIEYKKGNYSDAIQIYESALNRINKNEAYGYKYMVLKELEELYEIVGSEKLEYIENEIKNHNDKLKVDITNSYIKTSISEYENYKSIQEQYESKVKSIRFESALLILFIVTFLISYGIIFRLKHDNKIDGLTKVYNRKFFDLRYNKLLKNNVEFYLAIVDIDNFKSLNDKYGHIFGDSVLVGISNIINELLEKNSKVYRYGGEEFVILLRCREYDKVIRKLEEIRLSIENSKWDEDVTVTVSIGISNSKKENDKTLRKADENLYISKNTGKNKITE